MPCHGTITLLAPAFTAVSPGCQCALQAARIHQCGSSTLTGLLCQQVRYVAAMLTCSSAAALLSVLLARSLNTSCECWLAATDHSQMESAFMHLVCCLHCPGVQTAVREWQLDSRRPFVNMTRHLHFLQVGQQAAGSQAQYALSLLWCLAVLSSKGSCHHPP